jgi:taurine dioxygenase
MYLAYERLSEGMRRMLDGLTAVHDYHWASRAGGMPEGDADRETTAEHPVVRTHPVGGRRSLFVSQGFTRRFGGMTEEESAPILAMLAERSADPAIVYRHRWREGDLVFWDNRCTLHRAIRDYGDATRSMHRVTLRGERPTAAVARPIQFI